MFQNHCVLILSVLLRKSLSFSSFGSILGKINEIGSSSTICNLSTCDVRSDTSSNQKYYMKAICWISFELFQMGFCKEWNLKSIPNGCRCKSIDFDLRGPLINFPVVIPPAQELRRLDEPIATRLKNDADTLKFNSLIEFSSSFSWMKKN